MSAGRGPVGSEDGAMATAGQAPGDRRIGPVLYFQGAAGGRVRLGVLLAVPTGAAPPRLATPEGTVALRHAAGGAGHDIHLGAFELPQAAAAAYSIDGETFRVATDLGGDLRLAFVSCNGQEHGDLDRETGERNAMWARLGHDHAARPFRLLLHGGDQIYADEATETHPLSRGWPTDHHAGPLDAGQRAALFAALREAFFGRYLALYAQPEFAWAAARVPSLAMWDDHDICDGWGSLTPRAQGSEVGAALFAAAREAFVLFQCGTAPGEVPALCPDTGGGALGWVADLPGLRVVAPDLRSERRPDRVMGPAGWRLVEAALAPPLPERVLVMSSVPALGPRLSLIERWMQRTPWLEEYEDDLRDQWQSHAHRSEWQRFLRALVDAAKTGAAVTVVSGEIHLATRGTMACDRGTIHQLVASGIAHPSPPRAYAALLGTFARLGEAPLPGHPVRLRPLPGQRRIYAAERNYLTLERAGGAWRAAWHLEHSGVTPALAI